jgi:hypothetical protein
MDKDEGLVNRPPLLFDTNYDYWKSRMTAVAVIFGRQALD